MNKYVHFSRGMLYFTDINLLRGGFKDARIYALKSGSSLVVVDELVDFYFIGHEFGFAYTLKAPDGNELILQNCDGDCARLGNAQLDIHNSDLSSVRNTTPLSSATKIVFTAPMQPEWLRNSLPILECQDV